MGYAGRLVCTYTCEEWDVTLQPALLPSPSGASPRPATLAHPRGRFDDDDVAEVSPRQKLFLRGLPQPQGSHIRFD